VIGKAYAIDMESTADRLRARIRVVQALPAPEKRIELRERAGLSRADLAAAIGVTPGAVWLWEKGKRQPSGSLLAKYVEALSLLEDTEPLKEAS
jgi:DNA-binding XRE family transcriptional regulator